MDIHAFGENVIKALAGELPDCAFMKNEVVKNNGVAMHGLIVRKNSRTCIEPQFYLDGFYEKYQNGRKLKDIAKDIADIYKGQENRKIHQLDIAWMMGFENVKDSICFRLVNLEKNKELLQTMPYREMLDLALVYHLHMDVEECVNGYVRVTNHLMEQWGVNEQMLYEQALANTPIQNKGIVMPLDAVFWEMLNGNTKPDMTYESGFFDMALNQSNFYVCSNEAKSYGAAVILYPGLLEQMGREMGSLYILPSSVHEMLFLKASDEMQPEELLEMVHDVNETEVLPEEVLSDNIYFYDKKERKLKLITE